VDRVTIKIPRPLYEQMKKLIQGTGFSSVTEFVVYVLRDVVAVGKMGEEGTLTEEEMEQIRKRLRSLGYLK